MYKALIRPVLFMFPPELVHKWVAAMLRITFLIPGMAWLVRHCYRIKHQGLEREVFGIKFPNPVGVAAGFDKEATLYNHLANFGFGFVEIGTVTPMAQPGNPKPRLFRLPADKALINRMGFNNHGVKDMVEKLKKSKARVIIGGNIGKNTLTHNDRVTDDYCICFKDLFNYVDYFVVNVSCPNITGLSKLQNKDDLVSLLQAIQKINRNQPVQKPVLLKIAPDLNERQLDDVIEVVSDTKLDGIIATNTTIQRKELATNKAVIEAIGNGGLSGRPLRDQSTKTIAYLHHKSGGKIPIVAVGGIFTADDALEKLQAGATLVQVYTGFIYEGPSIAKKINKAMLEHSRIV